MGHQTEYILDSDSDLGSEQRDPLAALFDPSTIAFLEPIGIHPGWRCLDLGAGNGSISRWLADMVWPDGGVIAADTDTDTIVGRAGMRVVRCDVDNALPGRGPYDLIYARALLMHLQRREQIFCDLVNALAPGGWLVLAEVGSQPPQMLANTEDEEFCAQVPSPLDSCRDDGVSWDWAYQVEGQMAAAGMTNIAEWEYCPTMTDGAPEDSRNGHQVRQAEAALYEAGATGDELERFHALPPNSRVRAWPGLQMVFTRGQKPITETVRTDYVPNFLRKTLSQIPVSAQR